MPDDTTTTRLALLDALLDMAWKLPPTAIIRALQLDRRNPDPEEVIQMPELRELFNGLTVHGVYHGLEQLRNCGLVESTSHGGTGGGYRFQRIGPPPAKECRRG